MNWCIDQTEKVSRMYHFQVIVSHSSKHLANSLGILTWTGIEIYNSNLIMIPYKADLSYLAQLKAIKLPHVAICFSGTLLNVSSAPK